jgi:putative DNA primase/helicase
MNLVEVLKEGEKNPQEAPESLLTTWQDMEGLIGPISFDWKPWLPVGLLTILASEAGIGKSALALRIAGSYILGLPWPDNTPFSGELGAVLWCESEAAQAVNLDRAKTWGYPIEKFYNPLSDPFGDVNLDEAEHKEAIINKAGLPEVRFIVVDSLSGTNSRKESATEIKGITEWLARLARDIQKPLLLTHHLRKKGIIDTDEITLDRIRGSSAIVQAARVIWTLDIPDISWKDNKRLQVVKNNLARFPSPVGMMISESGVEFGDAPEAPKDETLTDKAADLLLALLNKEPVRAVDIKDETEQAGISWRTVNNAKKKLNIVAVKKGDSWYWSLPAK